MSGRVWSVRSVASSGMGCRHIPTRCVSWRLDVCLQSPSYLHDHGSFMVLVHDWAMLQCINSFFDFSTGAATKEMMFLVRIWYTSTKRMSVKAQRGRGGIEAFGCNIICGSAAEKCRDFRFQIGIELAMEHFEGESVFKNLTQSTGRIFGTNAITSDTIGKLTE